jgi:hypothetical protein
MRNLKKKMRRSRDQGIRRIGDEETSMNAEKRAEIGEIQRISLITLVY